MIREKISSRLTSRLAKTREKALRFSPCVRISEIFFKSFANGFRSSFLRQEIYSEVAAQKSALVFTMKSFGLGPALVPCERLLQCQVNPVFFQGRAGPEAPSRQSLLRSGLHAVLMGLVQSRN